MRISFCLAALIACGPAANPPTSPDARTDAPAEACSPGATRCVGNSHQSCVDGTFEAEACAALCDPELGCVSCHPGGGNVCSGGNVVACNGDGSLGGIVEDCAEGSECSGAQCVRSCTADGVDLIYVVDNVNNLYSFDPRLLGTATDPFRMIGTLNCPANEAVPGWTGDVSPFSMAVDRDAVAWVLYTSGEIFHVSTVDAACQSTAYVARQGGMDLFGMGFVTDGVGAGSESLFLGGGDVSPTEGNRRLASVNPSTLTLTALGTLTATAEYSPELTGTGSAELFGFYPGLTTAFVQQIDRDTGAAQGPVWSIPGGLGGTVRAWAFAQWGGRFYIFVTTELAGGALNSTVRSIDRATSTYQVHLSNLAFNIVGAGVSTCAPVAVE